jgi:hypothetical protein
MSVSDGRDRRLCDFLTIPCHHPHDQVHVILGVHPPAGAMKRGSDSHGRMDLIISLAWSGKDIMKNIARKARHVDSL